MRRWRLSTALAGAGESADDQKRLLAILLVLRSFLRASGCLIMWNLKAPIEFHKCRSMLLSGSHSA